MFFFNDTATTEIYTLSLHDALPILQLSCRVVPRPRGMSATRASCSRAPAACTIARSRREHELRGDAGGAGSEGRPRDRKRTRLNSSHANISYAVFCLKKKKTIRFLI